MKRLPLGVTAMFDLSLICVLRDATSQNRIVPSPADPAARSLPSGEKSMEYVPTSPGRVEMYSPLATSHSLIPSPPEANNLPSGEKTREYTGAATPAIWMVVIHFSLSISHTLISGLISKFASPGVENLSKDNSNIENPAFVSASGLYTYLALVHLGEFLDEYIKVKVTF